MDLDTLIRLGLLAIAMAGVAGLVVGIRYGARSFGWSVLALLFAVGLNIPILVAANARDPEAGGFGVLIISSVALAAMVPIALGAVVGSARKRGLRVK